MKEAVCSVIYAAPFLENSPELVKVRALFLAKYGGQFPQECVNSCCVNKKVKDGLARNMPDEALISYYLSNIQDAHNLEDLGEPTEADPTDDDDNDIDTKLPTSTASASPAPAAASKKSVPAPAKASPSPKSTSPSTTSPTLQSSVGSVSRQGLLRKDMNGNFWVNLTDGGQPSGLVFVPAKYVAGAIDGDNVICALDARKDSKLSGKILKVLGASVSSTSKIQSQPTGSIATTSNVSPTASFVQLSSFTSDSEFRQGIFRIDMSGHSWVGDEPPFVFVAPQGRLDAQHGDFVTVQLHPRGDSKLSGHVVSIVQRAPSRKPLQPTQVEEIEGILTEDEENAESDLVLDPIGDWFMKNGSTVIVPRSLASGAKMGDKVMVQVVQDVKQANKKIARVARVIKPRDDSFVEPFEVAVKILIDHEGNGHCPNTNSSALTKLPPGSNFVFIPKAALSGAKHGDKVSVRVNPLKRAQNGSLLGKVTTLLDRNPFSMDPSSGSSLDGYSTNVTIDLRDDEDRGLMGLADKAAAGAMVVDELDELSQVWDNNLNLTVSGISTAPKAVSAVPGSSFASVDPHSSDRDAAVDRIAAALQIGDTIKETTSDVSLERVLVIDVGSGFVKVGFCASLKRSFSPFSFS
jgi:exoribonuclease R